MKHSCHPLLFRWSGAAVSESFDAYFKWLGIPPAEQPPHYYRLLGIQLYESDREVINHASDRQMAHVRSFQLGKYAAESQKILNEISAARVCLLNEQAKARYDEQLRSRLDGEQSAPPLPAAPSQPVGGTADPSVQKSLFLAYLDGALARLSGKIVSQDQEFETTEWGRKRYGLSSEEAYAALRVACDNSGKTLASLDRSTKLTPLSRQQPAWNNPTESANSTVTAPSASTAAAQPTSPASGAAEPALSMAATASLPRIQTTAPRAKKQEVRSSSTNQGLIIAVIVGGVVLFGGLVASIAIVAAVFLSGGKPSQLVQRPQPARPEHTAERPRFVPADSNQPSPRPQMPFPQRPDMRTAQPLTGPIPSWWDGRTRALSQRAVIMAPQSAELVVSTQSDDPQTRAAAYRGLVELAARSEDPHIVRMVEPVLSGNFAHDPADSAAAAIRTSLIAALPAAGGASPTDARQCSALFDTMGLIMACIQYNGAPHERVDQLISGAGSRLGTEFASDPTRHRTQLQRAANAALSRRLYQNLAGRIADEQALRSSYHVIAQEVDRRAGAAERESLDVEFVSAALNKYPGQWGNYDFLVQQLCDSSRQETVLQMVDQFERTSDESLRQFMAERLLRRANLTGLSGTSEIAAAVRTSLRGGSVSTSEAERPATNSTARTTAAATPAATVKSVDPRWDQLSRTAGSALADVRAAPDDSAKLLQEVVNLAHATTLACAMSQGDQGRAVFDRLRSAGPPVLSQQKPAVAANKAPQPLRPTSRANYNNAVRFITIFNNDATSVESKINFFRSFVVMVRSGLLDELRGAATDSLAAFLLAPQSPEMDAELTKALPDLAQLPHLLLALADAIDQTQTDRARVESLLSTALARRVELPASGDWRQAARSELLTAAAARLSGDQPQQETGAEIFAAAIAVLRDLYAQQADLLGAPAVKNQADATPADVLRVLIKHLASEWSGADLPDDDEQHLRKLDQVINSIDYLSDNNLQETVMLQRVWNRLLLRHVRVQRPESAKQAAALEQELRASDRDSRHVLLQLREGQAKQLEAWLELNRPL